jgi:hypothetical protein
MDEVHQTIGQILDGFCDNHTDLFPAIELLKACYEQLPAGLQTEFFKVLAGRLQSEPVPFPSANNFNRSSHILIIRAWAAFGPADVLPKLLFSLLRPDTREAIESWAFIIGEELRISLGSYSSRFSDAALATIKGHCALVTSDQSIGLSDSRLPPVLVEVSRLLENLVKKIEFERNVVQKLRPQLNATRPTAPRRDVTQKVPMGRASQKFDRQLFTLKLSEPAGQMHIENEASDKAAFQGTSGPAKLGGSVLIRIVDGRLGVLRKWLKETDRICREACQAQGETITPEFVRETLAAEAMTAITELAGRAQSCVNNIAARTHEDPHAALDGLAMKVDRLKAEMNNRYEIEARELEYRNAPMEGQPRQKQVPAPQPTELRIEGKKLEASESQGMSEESRAYLDKIIACLAVEPADLWPEYGEAARYVRQLAEIEWNMKIQWRMSGDAVDSHRKREELLQIISRDYPEAARKLRLPSPEVRRDKELHHSAQTGKSGKRKALVEALGDVAATVAPSEPTSGLNLERSLFAPAPHTWISRASPKRDNQSRPRGDRPSEGLSHSPDYRSVTICGKVHTLTARQAQMIEILHKAHVNGNPDVSTAHVLEMLETKGSRWQDTFRTNPKAKRALIKSGARRGTLRLNL